MKEIQFDAAHRLMNVESKCSNIHGHHYMVKLYIKSQTLDYADMLLDFDYLKSIKEWIDDNWDHSFILNKKDIVNIKHCVKYNYKHFLLNGDPTAEKMAEFLIKYLRNFLLEIDKEHLIRADKVVVFETPSCSATAINEE